MMKYVMSYSWDDHVAAFKAEAENERSRNMPLFSRLLYKIWEWVKKLKNEFRELAHT